MTEHYFYLSSRACYDPAKTIILFPPSAQADTPEAVKAFAVSSGWETAAELDGAALIIPVVPEGWSRESVELPEQLYGLARSEARSRNGKSLMGRDGMVWLWETMIYLVGYEDGASFAGDCIVAHPNHFAASLLVGGVPKNYAAGVLPSDHWMVRNVSADYDRRNDEIQSSLWLMDVSAAEAEQALAYFTRVDGLSEQPERVTVGGIPALRYSAEGHPEHHVLLTERGPVNGLSPAVTVLNEYFDRIVRWKDGPDGTLSLHLGQRDFYTEEKFIHTSVIVGGLEYACAVHLPAGKTAEEVRGLPLVLTVHGRGEPARLFAEKNGWDTLADRTGAFVVAAPDSPGNIWVFSRDGDMFGVLSDMLCERFGLDRERVYLTGFSNGASITREVGTAYPEQFAAIAPYNGPVNVPGVVMEAPICPQLKDSGYELPYFLYLGDRDPVSKGQSVDDQLEIMLSVNGCKLRKTEGLTTAFAPDEFRTGDNHYTPERGYMQGDRFLTHLYLGRGGVPRVGYTLMKNMPHGAIREQSLATWEFLKHFRRPAGDRTVEYRP